MMSYRTVFGLGLFVTVLSLAGLVIPEPSTSFTSLLPNGNDAVFALLLGSTLMALAWAAYYYRSYLPTILGAIGGSLVVLAVVGIFYPMYFGLIDSYIRPANVLVLLVAGISYGVVALEIDRTAAELSVAPIPVSNARAATKYRTHMRAIKQASLDAAQKVRRPRLATQRVPVGGLS